MFRFLSVSDLEKDLVMLESSAGVTSGFIKGMEKRKSDLMFYEKILDQNLKYMKKRDSIPVFDHFEKAKKQKAQIKIDIQEVEKEIKEAKTNLDLIEKKIKLIKSDLKARKEAAAKILPFKKNVK